MQLFNSNSMESGHVSNQMSISDTESFHSPFRSESPLDYEPSPPLPSKALVKYVRSDPTTLLHTNKHAAATPPNPEKAETGGERRSRATVTGILRRSRREGMVRRAELGSRVWETVLCLVAFVVMVADKTQGWSGDSFYRYKEYRYCVTVTVIGFVYSGFQAFDLAYNLATGKHVFAYHLRYQFDFAMDQILAYLLVSASSSAATRVDNWVSNWGRDNFTEMASASIGMSFLAFAAFALSSLISGYNLCNRSTS